MRLILAAALALGCVSAASAQQDLSVDQSRLYVTDPAACPALERKGVDAWMDMDFLALSFTDGIQGMEFHCNFYDVKGRSNGSALFVSAICELPGEIYPDIMSVSPYDETSIQVISSADMQMEMSGMMETPEGEMPGATRYYRCDSLSELPR